MDGAELAATLKMEDAVRAIEDAIRDGLDPAADIPRSAVRLRNGHALLMPSEDHSRIGLKVAMVADGVPDRGALRIQATYLVFDADSLALTAMLDGTELTRIRTAAVSMAAIRPALPRLQTGANVVVFGSGPQALAHIDALSSTLPFGIASLTVAVRGVVSENERLGDQDALCLSSDSAELRDRLQTADVVVAATTAREPLFDDLHVGLQPVVIAVGSHEPGARELPSGLLRRSLVVVEDVETSRREAGDIIQAIDEGALDPHDIVSLASVVSAAVPIPAGCPYVFKSTGMSWEDLVVANAALARPNRDPGGS
ncbi:ornithine cyclodeaminase family protein [Phytohabitans kaempferiae]|uniref:Ornithine cyclodeaminase family protein n=1 Tax=Phytohabitans kaempferiae TaxID=1620943 RepID=A0ABV6M2E3_9ACTN